jgi:hypothetical protein
VKAFAYLAAVVVAVIGIGVGVSASSWNQSLDQFNDHALRFDYPTKWTVETYQDGSSFSNAIVFLSNKTMHAPCVRNNNVAGYSVTCDAPLSRLGYDGVLVEWWSCGFPGWTLAKQAGQPTSVSGRPAKESVVSGRFWLKGAQQDITVVIARTIESNFFEVNAFLSGPDLAQERSDVRAMIASTKILQP